MFEDAQTFFQKTLALGPNLIEAYYELGRAFWFNGQRDEAIETWKRRLRGEQVQSVGKALRRGAEDGGGRAESRSVASRGSRRAVALAGARRSAPRAAVAQDAPRAARSRPLHRRVLSRASERSRASLLDARRRDRHLSRAAAARRSACCIAIAPDARRFREWVGPGAPEWGAAIAFPDSRRIVMQGRSAGSRRRRSARGAAARARAPRAARVPRRPAAALVRRGLRELRGARVEARGRARGERRARAARDADASTSSTTSSTAGATTAQNAYALAYRAVVELASLDPARGLDALLRSTGSERRRWTARCARAYGITLVGLRAAVAAADAPPVRRARAGRRRDARRASCVADLVLPLYLARRQRDRRRMAALRRGGRGGGAGGAGERDSRRLLRGDDEPDFGGEPTGDAAVLIAP